MQAADASLSTLCLHAVVKKSTRKIKSNNPVIFEEICLSNFIIFARVQA